MSLSFFVFLRATFLERCDAAASASGTINDTACAGKTYTETKTQDKEADEELAASLIKSRGWVEDSTLPGRGGFSHQ